eukprot:c15773_g2_i1.p1 GENE.c15773_g2_i1~~c15773_g2_i1.p1  ORF type:complete len:498 (+),score=190.91 c15773_g2_i1:43-1494(+)
MKVQSLYSSSLFFITFLISSCFAGTVPEQVHIALAGPYGMSISWFTQDSTVSSTIKYGLTSFNLSSIATGSSSQYLEGFGFHHTGVIDNLKPLTKYFYSVGDDAGGYSSVFSFVSTPDSNTAPFSIAIFGDMGYLDSIQRPKKFPVPGIASNWTALATRQLLESLKNDGKIDLILHCGDIGYPDDAFADYIVGFHYEEIYNDYMNWLQNLTSTIPYMTAPGNHESECHSGACFLESKYRDHLNNFTAYNTRWKMPSASSGGVESMWYSFDYGPAHFVVLDTETDYDGAPEENHGDSGLLPAGHFAPNGTYLAWLENDLMKASAARAAKSSGYRSWIIAAGHRPYWELKGLGADALFQKYGVDIYFCGHVHSYTRLTPSYKGVVDRKAIKSPTHYHDAQSPVCIISGGAGCDEMEYVEDSETQYAKFVNITAEPFPLATKLTDITSNKVSLGVLDVLNQTAVHWTLWDSVTGVVLDELWLTKSD